MKFQKDTSPLARKRRKHLLLATLTTCIAGTFLGGAIHTIWLAAGRVDQMRQHSTYDATTPTEVAKHVQAAGEFFDATTRNTGVATYTVARAESLLRDDLWKRLAGQVSVPAGPFIMGTDRPESDAQDRPRHMARTGAYTIDKFPVTNAQYAMFVAETAHKAPSHWKGGVIPKGFELHPVVLVTWQDAADYCTWSGKRLPSEAEWEKAARGTDGRRWPWGNRMEPKMLNTYNTRGTTTSVLAHMAGASPYGVVDMAGNVSEWTADDFRPYKGSQAPTSMFLVDLKGSTYGAAEHYKPLRGGSWKSDPFSTSTYHRSYALYGDASNFVGFRCVSSKTHQRKNKHAKHN